MAFGLRHFLQLNRKASDNDAIFRANEGDAGKLTIITRITWWMPRVIPSQVQDYRLTW